jgi:hypothetical protein
MTCCATGSDEDGAAPYEQNGTGTGLSRRGEQHGGVNALLIKSLLEAAGIPAVIVGDPVLPNLPFEVRAPAEHVKRALELTADRHRGTTARVKTVTPPHKFGGATRPKSRPPTTPRATPTG